MILKTNILLEIIVSTCPWCNSLLRHYITLSLLNIIASCIIIPASYVALLAKGTLLLLYYVITDMESIDAILS